MIVRFLGSGDAFGSGGRANTCFHVESDACRFLIDCGATSLVQMKRFAVDRNAIDMVLVTHFHADHFGGIPFFILDAQFFSKRRSPLTIVGPVGLREWYVRALETAFPGASHTAPKFHLELVEIEPGRPLRANGVEVGAFSVNHGPVVPGPFVAYRIAVGGREIGYTGDTEWTDALVEVGHRADLLIAEAYFDSKPVRYHLTLRDLEEHAAQLAPKRLILTHMSDDVLARLPHPQWEAAHDGLEIVL